VEVCHAHGWAQFLFNKVASHCYWDTIWLIVFGAVVNDRIAVRNFFALPQHVVDFIKRHNEHSAYPFLACFIVSLCHTIKVPPKSCLPCLCHWIMHKPFITGNGFAGDGVYHGARKVLKVRWIMLND
jgi:hypothetical protein